MRGLKELLPGVKYGSHKVLPDELAGMIGMPHIGDIFYVDATNGHDTANSGRRQDDAYKTVGTAYGATADNNHDLVVVVQGEVGSGSGTAETANIAWSQDNTHLIGNSGPLPFSHRSRIITTTDSVDPCWTISGQGNTFRNVQIATWQASNDVLISLTSNRNSFMNVHLAGIGHATAGDDTSARVISASGAEENGFYGCTIGVDTVARSVANAEVELASSSTRNWFEDCFFPTYADNAGHLFVKAASAADVDRLVMFKSCLFHNAGNSAATTMTVAMDLHASLGGSVILWDSWLFGATDWADDFTNVEVAGGSQATGATAGLMVAAA